MNRDFFQFPSWVVAELNKQAQPKPIVDGTKIYLPPGSYETKDIEPAVQQAMSNAEKIADRLVMAQPDGKQILESFKKAEMEGIQAPKRKGRPAGSKNKPKGK